MPPFSTTKMIHGTMNIAVAVVRSFIQLTAIGYVINFIFKQDSLWFVAALIASIGPA